MMVFELFMGSMITLSMVFAGIYVYRNPEKSSWGKIAKADGKLEEMIPQIKTGALLMSIAGFIMFLVVLYLVFS